MRYVMQQKLISLGDDFTIQDENGRDAFFVDGKMLSLGDKLAFKDMQGNELARIEQKLLSWGPTYEIFRGDERVAVVKKSLFSILHCKFSVDVPGPNDLEAKGDFFDHEYSFTRGSDPVATVSKRWFSWRDTYGVEVGPGEDAILLLACAVVIGLACHKEDGDDGH